MSTVPSSSSAETVKEKKRLWDIILTTTPVALTVLATALASFSSKEMTKAQYHRATAAQNQSKVGDQWAFFQAKRVRTTVQLQKAERGAFDPEQARTLASRIPAALKRVDDEASTLLPKLDGEMADLKSVLQELKDALAKALAALPAIQSEIAQNFEKADVKRDLPYLSNGELPLPPDGDADPKASPREIVADAVKTVEEKNGVKPIKQGDKEIDPSIPKALEAIKARKPRADYEPAVLAIKTAVLQQAIEAAKAQEKKYDDASSDAGQVFGDLSRLLMKLKAALRPVERAALKLGEELDSRPRSASKNLEPLRDSLYALVGNIGRQERATGQLIDNLSAARADFDARRLDREARFNQEIAGLFEVEVSRDGFLADECMARKDIYMYGMLVAQAGVMIATFGLAVRLRGLLWALAALAGLAAVILFGMGLGVMTYIGLTR